MQFSYSVIPPPRVSGSAPDKTFSEASDDLYIQKTLCWVPNTYKSLIFRILAALTALTSIYGI